ncbi:hypothetical protein [Prosthecobacter sp.]|uniref:hypothetical protein n=1 Tax=Prosthecobacter sp. TaxID=1965333 RepID=UPI003783A893
MRLRGILKTLAMMLWLVCAWVLTACASSKRSEVAFREMERLARVAVANEDRPAGYRDDSGLGIQSMYMWSLGTEFWKAYSDARLAAGDGRARKELKALLVRHGVSAAMLVPMNAAVYGAEENAIVDAWLVSGGRMTALLKEMVGDPPDLERITALRKGRLRGY